MALLALLLENVGIDKAVRLGDPPSRRIRAAYNQTCPDDIHVQQRDTTSHARRPSVWSKRSACSPTSPTSRPTSFGPSRGRSTRSRPTSDGSVPKRIPGTDNRVLRVCRLLNRRRVRYLLAGGVAANLHGSVRATKDVDVLVPPDPKNMTRLLEALSELPYRIAAELDPKAVARKPITIVGDDPRVDILTVAWQVTFDQAYPRRVVRRIDGVRVPYLSRRDLVRSKQTGRAQDLADLEQLGKGR